MNRLRVAAALACALLSLGGGFKREIILYGEPFPNTLAVLVDASGSMQGEKYACAIRQAMWVAEQADDAGRVRFYEINDATAAEPQAWIKLPNAEALAVARTWLSSISPTEGTDLAAAAREVLALEESPLGVVIITDADVDGGPEKTRKAIADANGRRKEPATIGIVAIAPTEDHETLARDVASAAGGAYVRLRPKEARKP